MNVNIEANAPQSEEYSVDIGAERTPIRIKGTDRYFYMDFGDTEFPNRLDKARKEIISSLESQEPEKEAVNREETLATLESFDGNIRAALNKAFGYDVCADVFGDVSTIGLTVKGEFYFENFINSLIPIVEKEYGARLNRMSTRTQAYMSQKGKYPNPVYNKR